jgi:cysteine desulfurase
MDERTALVSVQVANNEIGTIQPIPEVAQIVHRMGAVFHCDAAQGLGRIPIDVDLWGVDLLSLSAHKCYGPKGVGALYIRGGARSAPLEPLVFGGGQELGMRPGTLNVPGIVGFGKACDISGEEMVEEASRIRRLRDWFEKLVMGCVPHVLRNGALSRRLPGNSSLRFEGVDAEALIANVPDIALSTGSACTSGAMEPSHVLTAIGLSRGEASNTIRVGIGRFTMESELHYAADRISRVVERIRQLQ